MPEYFIVKIYTHIFYPIAPHTFIFKKSELDPPFSVYRPTDVWVEIAVEREREIEFSVRSVGGLPLDKNPLTIGSQRRLNKRIASIDSFFSYQKNDLFFPSFLKPLVYTAA